MSTPDDERVGRLLIAIRRRQGLSQEQLARAARVPRRDIVRIENGDAGSVRLQRIRVLLDAAGGRARLAIWWNGAAADRLLDEHHALLVERAVALVRRRDWQTAVEVTFSEFGERGSIDMLAGHARRRALLVAEVKTEIGSMEEMNRMLDVKVRLGPKIGERTFGWRPSVVGRMLIVPSTSSVRRVVARQSATMATAYPARSIEVRRWLRDPATSLRGIWFLSDVPNPHTESR